MATRSPYVALKGTYVGATDSTLVTAGTGERLTIMMAVANNIDATTTESVKFHRVESGGSVGNENVIMADTGIAAATTIVLDKLIGTILDPGDSLSGIASTASKITVQIFVSRYIA